MSKKIIVIAPHADDEIIGCGATMAKHIADGDQVYVIVATNASLGAPELFSNESVESTRDEAKNAHKFLGVKETIFLDFPAPALNAYPEYKISIALSDIFNRIKPNTLYIPFAGDIHQDHKAIYRASLVAARPRGNYSIKEIYCYETLSETEWTPQQERNFYPTLFVDITDYLEKKNQAMQFFHSQIKEFPDPRSLECFEALAKYRGATVGVKYAEAFTVERIINS